MVKEKISDRIAAERQAAMKRSGQTKLLIGLGLIGLAIACFFVSFSTNAFIAGAVLGLLGIILASMGWEDYQDARKAQREMYLRGK